jgi:hypothetical protein
MWASKSRFSFSKRILDLCYLVCTATLVCVVGIGTFVLSELHHINPAWAYLSFMSIGFLVFAIEEYRKEFRSIRFVLFVCVWLVINLAVVLVVLGSFGWLYLILALVLEQVLFYMTAYWLFGLQPPMRRRPLGR